MERMPGRGRMRCGLTRGRHAVAGRGHALGARGAQRPWTLHGMGVPPLPGYALIGVAPPGRGRKEGWGMSRTLSAPNGRARGAAGGSEALAAWLLRWALLLALTGLCLSLSLIGLGAGVLAVAIAVVLALAAGAVHVGRRWTPVASSSTTLRWVASVRVRREGAIPAPQRT